MDERDRLRFLFLLYIANREQSFCLSDLTNWQGATLTETSGKCGSITLILTNGGTGVQTWFSGTKWPSGTAPTLTASGVDVLSFFTTDGGTTWRGVIAMTDSK